MNPSRHIENRKSLRQLRSSGQAFKTGKTRGVALVVVLGMLVLVLVLVVAFLSSVSVELQSAKKYSSGADARALADSAVSLVISQIQDATDSPQLAWASQPGMIRTFRKMGRWIRPTNCIPPANFGRAPITIRLPMCPRAGQAARRSTPI